MTAPPHSIDAEQALLGAVLMQNDSYFLASEHIDADCFSEPLHAKFWEMIQVRMDAGRKVDPVQLAISLGPDAEELIGDITVREYIARIAANATSILSTPDYARTIHDLWKRRRLIAVAEQISHRANGGYDGGDVDDLFDEFDSELTGIRYGQNIAGVRLFGAAADEALKQTAENYQSHGKCKIGLETGISEIDSMVAPLMGGDLVTIAAPSGHGKTSVAAQILCAASLPSLDVNQGRPSFFVSMEMGAAQIARRVMATWTGISTRKQRAGSIDVSDYERLEGAARSAAGIRIFFDEGGRQTFSRIARKARAMKRLYGIGSMVIDHTRLIRAENPKMGVIETIEHAAMNSKDLAKELDIVVFLLAQLTRESQKGAANWRFTDQALYGGEMIKNCSDIMLGVVIPDKWLRQREPDPQDNKEHDRWMRLRQEWRDSAEVGTLKFRDGEDGYWTKIPFNGERLLFGTEAT